MTKEMEERAKLRILLIDDEQFSQQVGKSIIETAGFVHVDVAKSVKQAIQFMGFASGKKTPPEVIAGYGGVDGVCQPYDLIVCDYEMPAITGVSFLKMLRSGKIPLAPYDTRFALLTMHSDRTVVAEALQYAVCAYFIKPINLSIFEAKLKAVFSHVVPDKPEHYNALRIGKAK